MADLDGTGAQRWDWGGGAPGGFVRDARRDHPRITYKLLIDGGRGAR